MAEEGLARILNYLGTQWSTYRFYGEIFLRHLTPRRLSNLAAVEIDVRRKSITPKSQPFMLKIETTNRCNSNCVFCLDGRREPVEGERDWGVMGLDEFERIMERLGERAIVALLYGLGEPLMDPTIAQKVAMCRGIGLNTLISTNLLPSDRSIITEVVEAGVSAIRFSCHGASSSTYAKYARVNRYDEAISNLEYLVELRRKRGGRHPLIEWQICFNNFNRHELKKIADIVDRLGLDHLHIRPMWAAPGQAEEWMPPDVIASYSEADSFVKCPVHYRELMINWDGSLRPCCSHDRLMSRDLGYISDFDEVWVGRKYKYIRALTSGNQSVDLSIDVPCNSCPFITGENVANW